MERPVVMRRIRAVWRALFAPEPPARLDGMIIQLRTMFAAEGRWTMEEWCRQRDIRGAENRQRELDWLRGEKL
jgi:hypothetical protein